MSDPFLNLKDNQIEIIILSYLIKHPTFLDEFFDKLNDKIFHNPEHKKILHVLNEFSKNSKNITVDSLKNYLPEIAKETVKELVKEVDSIVYSKDTFLNYLLDLEDLYLRREIFKTTQNKNQEIANFTTDKNVKDIIVELEKEIFEITNFKKDTFEIKDFKSVGTSSLQLIEKAFHKKGKISGISTGFIDLDDKLGGMQNSDLIILAGRPSMGKTALATNIAYNAAQNILKRQEKSSIAFFSLEMSSEQLSTRILSEQARIKSDDIRRGKVTEEEINRYIETSRNIYNLPLYIDETPAITIATLSNRARRIKRLFGLNLIVVDYIQLMRSSSNKNDGRVQEISEITQGLKALAKELSVPVLALSQLSRAVEQRDDKQPQLADLRESGSIEQDADVVMFVYREAYYLERKQPKLGSIEHAEWQSKMNDVNGLADIILGKQRHGPTGTVKVEFEGIYTKFKDLSKN